MKSKLKLVKNEDKNMIIDLEKSDLSDEFYSSGSEKKIEDLKI
jgi:hypothetical protein